MEPVPLVPGPGPGSGPAAPGRPPRRRRRVRWPVVFGVVAGLVVMLCGGLGAVGYVWYDRATAPDLSAPDVVVDAYLREELVNRDDTRAEQYLCDGADMTRLDEFRSNITARESQYNVPITITWGKLDVSQVRNAATVSVVLRIDVPEANGSTSESIQDWQFQSHNDDGWHICGASKIG